MINQEGLFMSWSALPYMSESAMLLLMMHVCEYAWKLAGDASVQEAALHHAADGNGQIMNAQMDGKWEYGLMSNLRQK